MANLSTQGRMASVNPVVMLVHVALVILCATPVHAQAAEYLRWRTRDNRVDADIEHWRLAKVLQTLTLSTGWRVYIEPGINPTVSTKFTNLSPSEALSRLLGDLSFALQRKPNQPTRLYIYTLSIGSATELVEAPPDTPVVDAKGRFTRELVVSLKAGAGMSIEDLAKKIGAKVIGKIDGSGTYRLEFESADAADAARKTLAQEEEVSAVDSNYQIHRPPNPEALTLASPTPLRLTPASGGNGGAPVIGLIDTAVQASGAGIQPFLLPQQNVAGEAAADNSTLNHGTAMASTILRGMSFGNEGGSTAARILPIDVYGQRESTSTYDVARGIAAAVQGGATIINLSLGSETDTPYLQRMISDLHSKGVMFVGAAGNEPTTAPSYPAAYPEVVAVTAGDRNGNLADYANRGSFVDVVAPGSSIVNFGDRAFLGTGTSYSAAYVTGLAAGSATSSKLTVQEVEAQIRAKLGKK